MDKLQLTAAQATAIIEAHEIDVTLDNEEEAELLKENNPELFDAYIVLRGISAGD